MITRSVKISILFLGIIGVFISCKKEKHPMVPYTTYEVITVNMGAPSYVCILKGKTILLQSPEIAEKYDWSTGDTTSSISVNASGTYTLTTTLSDISKTYNLEIFDCPSSAFIPNAFTPNGDGINDIFLLKGLSIRDLSMIVFDFSDGRTIFILKEGSMGWDGKNTNGKLMPEGSYPYHIEYITYDNTSHSVSGVVTLIRNI